MADIEELIHRLRTEKKQIESDLMLLKHEEAQADEQREGSPFGKREDGATETSEREKRMALENKLKQNLIDVNEALTRYEAGTYGICNMCKKPIEAGRLEAFPQAALCLACKSKQMKNARTR